MVIKKTYSKTHWIFGGLEKRAVILKAKPEESYEERYFASLNMTEMIQNDGGKATILTPHPDPLLKGEGVIDERSFTFVQDDGKCVQDDRVFVQDDSIRHSEEAQRLKNLKRYFVTRTRKTSFPYACNEEKRVSLQGVQRRSNPKELQNKHAAFTLSEVLIALMIIAIIAMLTVPALINEYRKTETVVRLQKVYSDVQKAVNLSVSQNGFVSSWDWNNRDAAWLNKYFLPYFNIVKSTTMQEVIQKDPLLWIKDIKGNYLSTGTGIYGKWGCKIITLPSGSDVFISYNYSYTPSRHELLVDLNGIKNKPNQYGKDIFRMSLWKDSSMVRFASESDSDRWKTNPVMRTIDELKNNCYESGGWCGALIQANNWKIPDDYPVKF